MLVPLSEIEKILEKKLDSKKVEESLTMIGLEVENVESWDFHNLDKKIVIGQILTIKKHPDADKLQVCMIDIGNKKLNIVCGASNISVNDFVPVATNGAFLPVSKSFPDGIKIKKTKLRGIESDGMLCSLNELSIPSSSDGIFILPDNLNVGTPINEISSLNETIFDVSITPNRGDCLSFYGIARELASILKLNIKNDCIDYINKNYKINDLIENEFTVINNSKDLNRYTAIKISNINVTTSSPSLKFILSKLKQKSINNIVDLTNYLMFLTGQPLHAFDYDKISGHKILINDDENDSINVLDNTVHKTTSHMVISDGKGPIAFAGIIGGLRTSVDDDTKNILLECASFNPVRIRKSAKILNISTESSYRFERFVSEYTTHNLLHFCAEYISKDTQGNVSANYIDTNSDLIDSRIITLNLSKISKVLGIKIDNETILKIYESLSIKLISNDNSLCKFRPPKFRSDLTSDADLIEEIARTIGLDSIPPSLPHIPLRPAIDKVTVDFRSINNLARDIFSSDGFSEVINYSFNDDETLFPEINKIKILNPHSKDSKYLRTSLLPSLLQNASYNFNHNVEAFKLFEIGSVFVDSKSDLTQKPEISLLSTQKSIDNFWKKSEDNFFDLKNSLLKFFTKLKLKTDHLIFNTELPKDYRTLLHPGKSSGVYIGKTFIGFIGEIHPQIAELYNLKKTVTISSLFVEEFYDFNSSTVNMSEFTTFPIIQRDLSIVVNKEVESQKILDIIKSFSSPIIKDTFVFDLFEDASLGKNKKSLSFSVVFGANDRTLEEDEVSLIMKELLSNLKRETKAEIRE
tara:strand:+ start:67941 stop:70364 length:2424 start_codon:yes stop_codon:yes gene_type:complete